MMKNPDLNYILNNFPKFELSYEIMTHKKVHNADILLAIPEGIKYYAWFTFFKSENVCFLLELNNKNVIINVKQINVSFEESLSSGTIFYGTYFKHNNINCFCIEDVYYYKGKNTIYVSYLKKLELLRDTLKNEVSQTILNNNFTIFGLPLIHSDLNQLLKEIQLLPYKVSKIKNRFFAKQYLRKIMTMNYFKPGNKNQENRNNDKKKELKSAIFNIKADIEPDIYNLFSEKDEYVDIAFIPDYKTSVMMNKLFRNIKENDNLDALEESDDDEEFEDDRKDKYVYLDKSYKMNCEYNHKFKRWVPVNLVEDIYK
jgi:hypothetical protein